MLSYMDKFVFHLKALLLMYVRVTVFDYGTDESYTRVMWFYFVSKLSINLKIIKTYEF